MPQAWARIDGYWADRIRNPGSRKVSSTDVFYSTSDSNESRVVSQSKPQKVNKVSYICKESKFPLWCVVVTVGVVSLILLLVFGLAFGLTYNNFSKNSKEAVSTTTTLKPKPECKNFGIWNSEENKCECRDSTTGEFCENLIPCDDLPDDPEECEYLETLPDVDKVAFEQFCPKSSRC